MKAKKIELDVDFIGGQDPLTTDEEKALNIFFKQRKLASRKSNLFRHGQNKTKRVKATA
jgi:hypothetical protein